MEKYIKVYIKSEDDLPKKDGYYFVSTKGGIEGCAGFYNGKFMMTLTDKLLNEDFDWYLFPEEQSQQAVITEEEIFQILSMNSETMAAVPSKTLRSCAKEIMEYIKGKQTVIQSEEPDINFRKYIAQELSREELIDRLCEMNESYQSMRKEWFEKCQLNTQAVIMPTEWEKLVKDFIDWDNEGHSNASQRQILDWFKSQLQVVDLKSELKKYEDWCDSLFPDMAILRGEEEAKINIIDEYLNQREK